MKRLLVAAAGLAGAAIIGCTPAPAALPTSTAVPLDCTPFREAQRAPQFSELERTVLSQEERVRLAYFIETGALIADFERLPVEAQQATLSELERYALTTTYAGSIARNIEAATANVTHREDPKPEYAGTVGIFEYDKLSKTVSTFTLPPTLAFRLHVDGRNPAFGTAHERFHALQNQASPWYDFEAFLAQGPQAPLDQYPTLTPELAQKFSTQFGQDSQTVQEAARRFKRMLANYNQGQQERNLIAEVQAFMLLEPHTTAQQMRNHFARGETYAGLLSAVPSKDFVDIVDATLQQLGVADPLTIAKIGGQYGESVDSYVKATSDLVRCSGYTAQQARTRGIERQELLLSDIFAMTYQAEREIKNRMSD